MKINLKKIILRAGFMALVVGGGLLVNERAFVGNSVNLITSADARVGRPLTPMSYAGVARRTTRAVIATTPVYVAPVVVAPTRTCVQAVDAYGRLYTRCY